jgi:hypothetical protein
MIPPNRARARYLVVPAILGAAVLGLKAPDWYAAAQSTSAPAQPSATVLLWFGTKATANERWDGSVSVTSGRLLGIEGRHFSEGDAIAGEREWRAQTRTDRVAPYADIHYTEMRPGSTPEVRNQPVGVYLHLDAPPSARVQVSTAQGNFDFSLEELSPGPKPVLDARAEVMLVPSAQKITSPDYEDDEPSLIALPDGKIMVAWVAYKDRADRVMVRTKSETGWTAEEEVSARPGDIFKASAAAAPDGTLWVFWSEREGERWFLWGRSAKGGSWSRPEKISDAGSATFHQAAASANGSVFVAWQSFRNGQSDIYMRAWRAGRWGPELKLSESRANDWEPAIAAGADGTAHVVWDSYDRGNYDIHYRSAKDGSVSELARITSGPRFQAHASVAVDPQGRPWIAWNESGVNWAKDQGFLIATPLATPLHQERWIQLVFRDNGQWQEPWPLLAGSLPADMRRNAEHPRLAFGTGSGSPVLLFRHWTRRNSRSIGSPLVWESFATTYDGQRWMPPKPLPHSGTWIEKHAALASSADGNVWAAWMSDNRPFATMIPGNADIYFARLDKPGQLAGGQVTRRAYVEPFEEAIPIHTNDDADVKAIRAHRIQSGGTTYRIFRGDMHRHTDISTDFKYDGSLFEVYRYGLDAAAFDYIAPTDHQTGFDQEYSWWQNQKYVDLFHVPPSFIPLFAYERSLRFPNGHRNVVWARRGFRTLPIPPEEASGKTGARKLFENLRQTGGISMPHTSATDQGTDWRDNDPDVEPLMEIFQGYRASYEYEGAPRAATSLNQHAQKSGWQPSGFWWNALAKGYKLGVQASSDHWSTHISYACLLVEGASRENLLAAIRKRHAYAATDNIILDFKIRAAGKEYIMGDALETAAAPELAVLAGGTNTIKQIDIIRDKQFIYANRPQSQKAEFRFTDTNKGPGESWYYVRVLQEDGQMAWSSPIWVKRP